MIARLRLLTCMALCSMVPLVGCERGTPPVTPARADISMQRGMAPRVEQHKARMANDRRAPQPAAVSPEAGLRECTFDDMKFDMNKDDPFERRMLTPQIEAIHGKRIRIRGYILPSYQQTGLAQFVLVRDNMQCCFGPGAALFDCILVEMTPGKSTSYTVAPVAVEGTFSIRELLGPDGKHLAIYHLAADAVK